jgi:polysaccharide pyruvyl transferase WcaK-like protein
MQAPKVLMMGYNGANNTGAEALLLSDIEDVRAVLGPDARLTIPSLNPTNLRRYVRESPTLRIAPLPSVFPLELWRLVRQQDLVLLVEGSAYMDTWTSALLWAFLWVTHCAHQMKKPCLAYAVDAGQLRAFNQWLVRKVVSETDQVVVRSMAAAERLRRWGVSAPIVTTADNAFTFQPDPADAGVLRRAWPASEVDRRVVGLAVVDFNLFPVVVRLWGKAEDCYRWPYYFSRSAARRRASDTLAAGYARLADAVVDNHDASIALVCMEELDERIATAVQDRMRQPERARVFSSRQLNASQMTQLLRELDVLLTSRYHASILSLAAAVPQLAVGHDLRLRTLYHELGLDALFFEPDDERLWTRLQDRIEGLLREPELVRPALERGYMEHLAAARRNRNLLREFVAAHGFAPQPEQAWQTAA